MGAKHTLFISLIFHPHLKKGKQDKVARVGRIEVQV
jgi:hypothetical protein